MKNKLICPVCNFSHLAGDEVCKVCGFDKLSHEFYSQEDYDTWSILYVLPYKTKWQRNHPSTLDSVGKTDIDSSSDTPISLEVDASLDVDASKDDSEDEFLNFYGKDEIVLSKKSKKRNLKGFGILGVVCFAIASLIFYMNFSNSNTSTYTENGIEIPANFYAAKDNLGYFHIEDGVLQGYIGKTSSLVIPNKVKRIESLSLINSTTVKTVTLSKNVKEIGSSVFLGCENLEYIDSGKNKNYIDIDGVLFTKDGSTLVCYPPKKADKEYVIPNGVTTIEAAAFYGSTNLSKITIPNTVLDIGHNAFESCTDLADITISDSVTNIGWDAFKGCTSLTSITIPKSVTFVGFSAFDNCTKLKSIKMPKEIITAPKKFENCPAKIQLY